MKILSKRHRSWAYLLPRSKRPPSAPHLKDLSRPMITVAMLPSSAKPVCISRTIVIEFSRRMSAQPCPLPVLKVPLRMVAISALCSHRDSMLWCQILKANMPNWICGWVATTWWWGWWRRRTGGKYMTYCRRGRFGRHEKLYGIKRMNGQRSNF